MPISCGREGVRIVATLLRPKRTYNPLPPEFSNGRDDGIDLTLRGVLEKDQPGQHKVVAFQ